MIFLPAGTLCGRCTRPRRTGSRALRGSATSSDQHQTKARSEKKPIWATWFWSQIWRVTYNAETWINSWCSDAPLVQFSFCPVWETPSLSNLNCLTRNCPFWSQSINCQRSTVLIKTQLCRPSSCHMVSVEQSPVVTFVTILCHSLVYFAFGSCLGPPVELWWNPNVQLVTPDHTPSLLVWILAQSPLPLLAPLDKTLIVICQSR